MDRYLAWLMTGGENILRPTKPKTVMAGFVVVLMIVLFLASLGYIIHD